MATTKQPQWTVTVNGTAEIVSASTNLEALSKVCTMPFPRAYTYEAVVAFLKKLNPAVIVSVAPYTDTSTNEAQ